jgi:hypothetical protein
MASFGSRNRLIELNDYFIGIVIILFGRSLFLEIVIFIKITIALQRRITILKEIDYILKKKNHSVFYIFSIFLKRKKKKKTT